MSAPYAHVAVLLPCYNEEAAIAKVVADFRRALPGAAVYVYDNNSRDRTAELARAAGAVVRTETHQGKGNVVRRMFSDVEAEVYLMSDGDDTYPADRAAALIERLEADGLDMVVGRRVSQDEGAAYRAGHVLGNRLFTGLVGTLFGARFEDIFSGYRVFSRRFVKSFPSLTHGFEIETELTVHTLMLRLPAAELPVAYGARPAGSVSKLRTYRDGLRILMMVLLFVKEVRPFAFFTGVAALLAALSIALALPIFAEYLQTGLVPRFPTAILSTGIMIFAGISAVCGVLLDSVSRGRLETLRLHYLAQPAPRVRGGAVGP